MKTLIISNIDSKKERKKYYFNFIGFFRGKILNSKSRMKLRIQLF
jgi:hypothetical protein